MSTSSSQEPASSPLDARRGKTEALGDDITSYPLAALAAADVMQRLDAAGIANARMNTLDDVRRHPRRAARERWRGVETAAGTVPALPPPPLPLPLLPALPPPGLPDGLEPRMDAVPARGQHTDAILADPGDTRARIDAPRASGTI